MLESELKNDMLTLLLENPQNRYGTHNLARHFDVSEEELIRYITLINQQKGTWVDVLKEYGDNMSNISLNARFQPEVTVFLNEGGFVSEFRDFKSHREEEIEIRALHRENLRLSNQAALDAQLDAARSKRNATISIWAAVVSAVAAVAATVLALLAYQKQ